jgi:putative endonuclease
MYVLKSEKDGQLYIGSTNDLNRRFKQHNDGQNISTKERIPFVLVYYEAYRNKNDAVGREKKLKQFKNSYTELKKRIKNSL